MKVLLINGSPHREGNTSIALSEVAKALRENDVDAEIVSIDKGSPGLHCLQQLWEIGEVCLQ